MSRVSISLAAGVLGTFVLLSNEFEADRSVLDLVQVEISFCNSRLLHLRKAAPYFLRQLLRVSTLVQRRRSSVEEYIVEEGEGGVASEDDPDGQLEVELPLVPPVHLGPGLPGHRQLLHAGPLPVPQGKPPHTGNLPHPHIVQKQ